MYDDGMVCAAILWSVILALYLWAAVLTVSSNLFWSLCKISDARWT